jgi:hypothetical protein
MISRWLQLLGRVCFFLGRISRKRGSRIAHSASLKLLEYGIVNLSNHLTLIQLTQRCQMSSILIQVFNLRVLWEMRYEPVSVASAIKRKCSSAACRN